MSMNIDNSLINARSFLTDTHLADAKEVKNGDVTSNIMAMTAQFAEGIAKNVEGKLKELSQSLSKTTPELRAPEMSDANAVQSQGLQGLAGRLEQLIELFGSEDKVGAVAKKSGKVSTEGDDSGYVKINENAFAALYSELLDLFAKLNLSSSKLTGLHAELAEKLSKSSAEKMINGAVAQKNQAIAAAATSMGMGGVGLVMNNKGINQQQKALKQNSISQNLNDVNMSLKNTVTNGSNLNKVSPSSSEQVGSSILNNNNTMITANSTEAELLKLAGNKKANTGQTVGGMGQSAGNMVSSGYTVESATENAGSQMDSVAKDNMLESEVKNRDNQNAVRNSLKQLLDLVYQTMEKNNEAVSHTAQMLKV